MIRALFICSQNRLRSPTAERIFSSWQDVETKSAGLDADAVLPLQPQQLAWASLIFVMEKSHRNKLNKKFQAHLHGKSVVCLNIADEYEYMQEELIHLLLIRAGGLLRSHALTN